MTEVERFIRPKGTSSQSATKVRSCKPATATDFTNPTAAGEITNMRVLVGETSIKGDGRLELCIPVDRRRPQARRRPARRPLSTIRARACSWAA